MGLRIAEIGEHALAGVSRNMPLVALDRRLADIPIGADPLPQILRVMAMRQLGIVRQIAQNRTVRLRRSASPEPI